MATVNIIVYTGDPVDAYEYRHTALFIEFPDGTNILLHITGASGFFAFDCRQNQRPADSRKFAKQIYVATIQGGVTRDAIQTQVASARINNTDRSWNCQHWVGDALMQLARAGFITQAQVDQALDAMADVLLEAED